MEFSDQSTADDNPFLRPSNSANTIPSLFNSQSRATSVSSTSFPLFSATGKNYGNPVLHSPESSIKRGTRNIMSPLSSIKRTRTSVAGGLQSARKVGGASDQLSRAGLTTHAYAMNTNSALCPKQILSKSSLIQCSRVFLLEI